MARMAVLTALAVGVLAVLGGECQAQVTRPAFRRPSVSPYLNLLLPNDDGLPNYQTMVRPFVEQRRRNQDFAREIGALQSAVVENNIRDQRGDMGLRPTGHSTVFLNNSHFFSSYHSHFFPTLNVRRR